MKQLRSTAGEVVDVRFKDRAFRLIHSDPEDHIVKIWKSQNKFYEVDYLVALSHFIKPGDLVIDVGANVGNHSVFFAGVCQARVIAFEPNEKATELLKTNIEVNDLAALVRVETCALGSLARMGRLDRSRATHNLGAARLLPGNDIEIRTLDSIELPAVPRLIKIDVEGMDYEVLEGAQATLAASKAIVAVETATRAEFLRISEFLEGLGYLCLQSHNYTPTQIFHPLESDERRSLLKHIAREIGLRYVEQAATRDRTNQQVRDLSLRFSGFDSLFEDLRTKWIAELTEVRKAQDAAQSASIASVGAHGTLLGSMTGEIADLRKLLLERQAHETLISTLGDRIAHLAEVQAVHSQAIRDLVLALPAALEAEGAKLSKAVETLSESVQANYTAASGELDALRHGLKNLQMDQVAAGDAHANALERLGSKIDSGLDRIDKKTDLSTETGLLIAAWLEAELSTLRTDIIGKVQHTITRQIYSELANRLDHHGRQVASLLGDHYAELLIDVDRRLQALRPSKNSSEGSNSSQSESASPTRRSPSDLNAAHDIADEMFRLVSEPFSGRGSTLHGASQRVQEISVGSPKKMIENGEGQSKLLQREQESSRQRSTPLTERKNRQQHLAQFDFTSSWGQARSQGAARLLPAGIVSLTESDHEAGVELPPFECEGGGLVEVSLAIEFGDPPDIPLVLRLSTDANERVGPDFPLSGGQIAVHAFAPYRTKQLRAAILYLKPSRDVSFKLLQVTAAHVDVDDHLGKVRGATGEPVIASMASIPSRCEMLRDSVASLLVQCDAVRVFLNNYPDIPDFLDHPRIEFRRSQDWDDRGDAGKAFWLDKDDQRGYRLLVDDDLIFPPNFATVMCGHVAAHANRAIFATHGVILRQPIQHYYDHKSRAATFHFGQQLGVDRTVHIGATNALCLHTSTISMQWSDFMYCNSADIWLARYAQKNRIPIFTPSRPEGWVRENRHPDPNTTIYRHSQQRTRSRFDSSLVQNAVLRYMAPLTLQPSGRPKLGFCIVATNSAAFEALLASWHATRALNVDWVVLLAQLPEVGEVRGHIEAARIEHETHVIEASSSIDEALRRVEELSRTLGFDTFLVCADTVRFIAPDWARHLVSLGGAAGKPLAIVDADNAAECVVEVPVKGTSLVHGLILPCESQYRLPRAEADVLGAAAGLGSCLGLEGTLDAVLSATLTIVGKQGTCAQRPVGSVSREIPVGVAVGSPSFPSMNNFFERAVVLNLDRRPDRWASIKARLNRCGIRVKRFSAVDEADPELCAEYNAYARGPLLSVSSALPPLQSSEELYMRYPSQMARVAHIEQVSGMKAIASPVAWAYLKSYEKILEQALEDGVETLLVLDDDVLLHKQTPEIFVEAMKDVPADWVIVQLGAIQYNWTSPWVKWWSPYLYSHNGAAVGSHAVGMCCDVIPLLLDHIRRMDMPYDIGALSAATRAFAGRSFVVYPNIAIPSLTASGIDTVVQNSRSAQQAAEVYRWQLSDYSN